MPRSKYQQNNPVITITFADGASYVFDEDTGEILDWPAGESRKMERILELALFADAQAKQWDDSARAFKAVIRRLLEGAGITKAVGGAGSANIVSYPTARVPGGDGFVQWMKDVEFPPDAYLALIACAQEFTTAKFEELMAALGIEQGLYEKAMVFGETSYVRLGIAKANVTTSRRPAD